MSTIEQGRSLRKAPSWKADNSVMGLVNGRWLEPVAAFFWVVRWSSHRACLNTRIGFSVRLRPASRHLYLRRRIFTSYSTRGWSIWFGISPYRNHQPGLGCNKYNIMFFRLRHCNFWNSKNGYIYNRPLVLLKHVCQNLALIFFLDNPSAQLAE